jgi:hypothetical protein
MDSFVITDQIKGSTHLVTVENRPKALPMVRIDGHLIPASHDFYSQVMTLLASFDDHFAGLEGPIHESL